MKKNAIKKPDHPIAVNLPEELIITVGAYLASNWRAVLALTRTLTGDDQRREALKQIWLQVCEPIYRQSSVTRSPLDPDTLWAFRKTLQRNLEGPQDLQCLALEWSLKQIKNDLFGALSPHFISQTIQRLAEKLQDMTYPRSRLRMGVECTAVAFANIAFFAGLGLILFGVATGGTGIPLVVPIVVTAGSFLPAIIHYCDSSYFYKVHLPPDHLYTEKFRELQEILEARGTHELSSNNLTVEQLQCYLKRLAQITPDTDIAQINATINDPQQCWKLYRACRTVGRTVQDMRNQLSTGRGGDVLLSQATIEDAKDELLRLYKLVHYHINPEGMSLTRGLTHKEAWEEQQRRHIEMLPYFAVITAIATAAAHALHASVQKTLSLHDLLKFAESKNTVYDSRAFQSYVEEKQAAMSLLIVGGIAASSAAVQQQQQQHAATTMCNIVATVAMAAACPAPSRIEKIIKSTTTLFNAKEAWGGDNYSTLYLLRSFQSTA